MYPTKEYLDSKWWYRLVKVLIVFIVFVSFLGSVFIIFMSEPWSVRFISNIEPGYSEVIAEERKIKDIGSNRWTLERDILNRLQDTSPEIRKYIEDLRKQKSKTIYGYEFPTYPESQIYDLVSDTFPDLRIKLWKEFDYSSLWALLLSPVIYLILWVFYYKIVLYIAYGKKEKN